MGLALFFLLLVWGYWCTFYIPFRLYRAERVAIGAIVGVFVGAWVLLLCSLLMPFRFSLPIGALLLVLSAAYMFWKHHAADLDLLLETRYRTYLWWGYSAVVGGFFIWLFFTHMLPVRADGWYTEGSCWGDLALHATLVSRFSVTDHIDFRMPLLYGGNLTYPFLLDFLSGMMRRLGSGMQDAFFVPGITVALAILQMFFFMGIRLFKRASSGILAMVLLFLSGSFANIFYFWFQWRGSGLPVVSFLRNPGLHDYIHFGGANDVYMVNYVLGALLPQRSAMLGLGVFLVALLFLFEMDKVARRIQFLLAGFLGLVVGLLPLAHVHTFFVFGAIMAWFAIADCLKRKTIRSPYLAAAVLALVIAAPQLIWQVSSSYHGGFAYRHFGWTKPENQEIITFWFRNIGIVGVFLVTLPVMIWFKFKDVFHIRLYIPLVVIFIACNIWSFQPSPWDNSKFLYYCYFGVGLYMAYFLLDWARSSWWRILTVLGIVFLATGAGIIAFVQETVNPYLFMSNGDLAFAESFEKIVPVDAVVLTADRHNHPVPVLTGRRILLGYRGWIGSYGADYHQIEQDERVMFAGKEGTDQLLKKYGVSYVVIGYSEIAEWGADRTYYEQHYKRVLASGEWTVYQVLPDSSS